jgi:aminopeptidase N
VDYWLGALVLHRLRAVLGREAFARGLADFTRSHLGQPVDSEDLRRSMERASQANLEGFFARWVYGAAPPRVQARVQAGPRSVTLRVTSDHEAAHGPLPLTVELEDAQGARRFTLALRPGAQTATWGHHPPLRALRVDPDHTLPWLTLNE